MLETRDNAHRVEKATGYVSIISTKPRWQGIKTVGTLVYRSGRWQVERARSKVNRQMFDTAQEAYDALCQAHPKDC